MQDGQIAQSPAPPGQVTLMASAATWAALLERLGADRASLREADQLRRAVASATGPETARRVTVSPALAALVLGAAR